MQRADASWIIMWPRIRKCVHGLSDWESQSRQTIVRVTACNIAARQRLRKTTRSRRGTRTREEATCTHVHRGTFADGRQLILESRPVNSISRGSRTRFFFLLTSRRRTYARSILDARMRIEYREKEKEKGGGSTRGILWTERILRGRAVPVTLNRYNFNGDRVTRTVLEYLRDAVVVVEGCKHEMGVG